MLEIGRVVDAGRQHRERRVALAGGRRDGLQRRGRSLRIVLDRRDLVAGEELRGELQHRLAVLEHVADARGRAEIVLEHVPLVARDAHDVDADDVGVDVARRIEPHHLGQKAALLRISSSGTRPALRISWR